MTAAITLARQYLAKLPITIDDPALHEVVAHLSGVLAALDEQKPAAYVRAAAFEGLKDRRIASVGAALHKEPVDGSVAIYLAPTGAV